ncbi:flagellar biosynthesis protein FlhF, partial [Campylobacter jejuni]|nr:flagellar biosynthesis protein FlhF [Campylobacter jejuni]
QIRPKTLNRSALYEVMVAIEESDYEEHLKNKENLYLQKKSSPKPSSTSLAEEKIRSQIPQEDEDVVLDFSNTRLNTNLN